MSKTRLVGSAPKPVKRLKIAQMWLDAEDDVNIPEISEALAKSSIIPCMICLSFHFGRMAIGDTEPRHYSNMPFCPVNVHLPKTLIAQLAKLRNEKTPVDLGELYF